jgi:gas vesicle protein
MMRPSYFLIGFGIGVALGGMLMLLLAPQSGEEMRGSLQSRVEAVLEQGRQAAAQTRAEAYARMADLKAGRGAQS